MQSTPGRKREMALARARVVFLLLLTLYNYGDAVPQDSGDEDASVSTAMINDIEEKFLSLLSRTSSSVMADDDIELTKFFQHYTESFFAPTESLKTDTNPAYKYHIQVADGNPLAQKDPELYARIMAMRVNFHHMNQEMDPLLHLHAEEKDIRANEAGADLRVSNGALKQVLTKVMNLPRNLLSHPQKRDMVGGYIYGKFGRLGLVTSMQPFRASRPKVGQDGVMLSEQGANIVGILPGTRWGTPHDKPIVVGAHWDTVPNTPGYNDNGSGMAALLEVASALARAKCLRNKNSVVFVAFDMEESGCHGSLEFIRTFVMPRFVDAGVELQGAYIMDTLLNFDDDERSQTIPPGWESLLPETTDRVRKRGLKGDFLAVIGRNSTKELRLADAFAKYHARLRPDRYRLEPLVLDRLPADSMATVTQLFNHTFFWRSDNSRFWYYTDERAFTSLGAVLLTDTALYRGYMRECYHQTCDFSSNPELKPDSLYFLSKTAQAVALAVAELSDGMDTCDLSALHLTASDLLPEAPLVAPSNDLTQPPPVGPQQAEAPHKLPEPLKEIGLKQQEPAAHSAPAQTMHHSGAAAATPNAPPNALAAAIAPAHAHSSAPHTPPGPAPQQQQGLPATSLVSLLSHALREMQSVQSAFQSGALDPPQLYEGLRDEEAQEEESADQEAEDFLSNALGLDVDSNRLPKNDNYAVPESESAPSAPAGGDSSPDNSTQASDRQPPPVSATHFQPNHGNQFNIEHLTVHVGAPTYFAGGGAAQQSDSPPPVSDSRRRWSAVERDSALPVWLQSLLGGQSRRRSPLPSLPSNGERYALLLPEEVEWEDDARMERRQSQTPDEDDRFNRRRPFSGLAAASARSHAKGLKYKTSPMLIKLGN